MPSHRTRALVVAGAAALLAACNRGGDKQAAAGRRPSTTPVVVAAAFTGSVPVTLAANGTVEPVQTVEVQPQVAGPITAVRFNEGDEVRAGQVLFEIDPRPAQAALAQAQAVLARDRATAAAAQADAQRYARLVTQGYVTQSQAGQQQASAQASQATLASDQAQVEAARLNLSYTTVRAPISGKTGTLNVRLGNQVRVPNPVPLVSINAVAPVLVRFPVPDRTLQQVRAAQRAGRKLEVVVSGAAVGGATERGVVDFIDNAVDTVSGSVTLKARFANSDRRLWPGAFLPLTLSLGETPNAVLVPNVAVQQGPQGPYVFVPAAGKAKQVTLTVDRTTPVYTVVTAGLNPGDTVVVDGQSRLFPGAAMKVARAIDARQPQQIASLGGGPGFGGAGGGGANSTGNAGGLPNGQGGGPGSGTAGGLNGTPVGGATGMTNGATNAQASANAAANAGGNGGATGRTTPGGSGAAGAAGAGQTNGAGVGGGSASGTE